MSGFRLVPSLFHHSPWGGFRHLERRMALLDQQFDHLFSNLLRLDTHPDPRTSDDLATNNVMVDEQGNRHLSLKFDVRKFKPEEIKIRSFDENKLEVSAKHETKSDNHQIYREFRRVCTLPEGVSLESLESFIHPDGILSVEAPMPPEPAATEAEAIAKKEEPVRIAIEHEKTDKDNSEKDKYA